MSSSMQHAMSFSFPLAESSHGAIIRRTLQVDKERSPNDVQTVIEEEDGALRITIRTTTVRYMRMTVNSLFESLDLIIRTLDAFGSPLPPRPNEAQAEGVSAS